MSGPAGNPSPSRDGFGGRLSRALGVALRRHRMERGWSQKRAAAESGFVEPSTLTTHERATRSMSVDTLAQYARLYDTTPYALLREAWTRTAGEPDGCVFLAALAVNTAPALAPLRAWAAAKLREPATSAIAVLELDDRTLTPLAELCGMTPLELVATLTDPGVPDA